MACPRLSVAVFIGLLLAGCVPQTSQTTGIRPVVGMAPAPLAGSYARPMTGRYQAPQVEITHRYQVRNRIKDACMYELGLTSPATERTAPRCACYADGVSVNMTPEDVKVFAASGELPNHLDASSAVIWDRCTAQRTGPAAPIRRRHS